MPIVSGKAEMVYSNVPENDYPSYHPGIPVPLNGMVMNITETEHKVYQSLVANNTGNPLTDATKWLDCGNTNRWKMHDGSLQSQTKNPGSIYHQYRVKGRCTAVAALNVYAAAMQVRMYDDYDGLVFDKTIPLLSGSGVSDWYQYFFNQADGLTPDAVITGLPPYGNALIEIILSAPTDDVACGALILGEVVESGYTQYGAKVGITDYSTKDQDQFGNYRITQRAFRKTSDLQVMVDNAFVDQLQIMLAQYRAMPVLYLGSDQFSSTAIYGFYRGFDITISYPQHSLCSINLEGLT